VDIEDLVAQMGGVASRGALLRLATRADIDQAIASGTLVVVARGRYAVRGVDAAVEAAHRLSGVLSRESAALHHGWAVKTVPPEPHVSVPRGRKVASGRAAGVCLHRDDLHADDVQGIATSKEYTLTQCLRLLSWDAALAIADSALRAGESSLLARISASARGPGAPQIRRVVDEASADAANPFESVLRAIALDVPGLKVRPQVWIGDARPDLVDEDLRIVIEADSFEWHGTRIALRRDAKRYNLLVVDGWHVLRFAWEDVMFDQDYVRSVLLRLVELVAGRTQVRCCCSCHA
jgi:very-short-patch-repair endonuclease